MSAYVTKQNCCYWPSNNINKLHQHPLHTAKVSVWCALSSHGITGPYCFEKAEGPTVSVNTEWYKVMPGTFLRNALHPASARFVVVPKRWSNCSRSTNIHAGLQDNVSGQTHFSFQGHHIVRLLA